MAKAEKSSKSEAPKKRKAVAVHCHKIDFIESWNSIEEFSAAIDASGVSPDAVNVQAEWDLYMSDRSGYKDHMNLRQQ